MEVKTRIFKINKDNPEDNLIYEVAEILKASGLSTIPTETVYGLAGNALDENAAKKIYAAKGRPSDNPLIVHLADISEIEKYAKNIPETAYILFKAFSPGPLTVILEKKPVIPDSVSGGLPTVALRIPDNLITRKLIIACGFPLAAPSANISGHPSPTKFSHTYKDLYSKVDALIDGGDCDVGVESTIVSLAGDIPVILRPGKVTYEEIKKIIPDIVVDKTVTNKADDKLRPLAPGMKYRHYAPKAPVIIVKGEDENVFSYINGHTDENTGVLCFDGEIEKFKSGNIKEYGEKNNNSEQAKHLFEGLRAFDDMPVNTIYARCPSDKGVGLAVYNRLVKASGFTIIEV